MSVYVASSWRNEFQPEVVQRLRDDGHEVYDFREADGFSWRSVDVGWLLWTPAQYLAGLSHPLAEKGFARDMDALRLCDACVMVMPCGPSASLEAGWAAGAGKRLIVYVPGLREPDLMVKMADLVTTNFDEVIAELRRRP